MTLPGGLSAAADAKKSRRYTTKMHSYHPKVLGVVVRTVEAGDGKGPHPSTATFKGYSSAPKNNLMAR